MSGPVRVLVVTPRIPYPVVGGDKLRIYEICRELSRHAEITLLTLCETAEELRTPLPEDIFTRVHKVLLPKWRSYLGTVRALITGRPLQLGYFWSAELKVAVRREATRHDVVVGHLIRVADYLEDLACPVALELTDAISLSYRRVKESGQRSLRSFLYGIELDRLRRREAQAISRFPLVSFVARVDAEYLAGCPLPERVIVAGNGVSAVGSVLDVSAPSIRAVAFIGNMSSLPNQDAVAWFAMEALPLLREHGPYIFRVVGPLPPAFRARLEKIPGVDVLGQVPSVADAVVGCYAAVCPVRVGAGVQNKLLEYMSFGLPAVSTSNSLLGLDAVPNVHVRVADDPRSFAGELVTLWESRELRVSQAREARRFVEEHHSWSNTLEPLVRRILELKLG